MDLKIIMVEGPHDGAFISKVMQVHGYKTCSIHIKDYKPSFIAKYLKNQYNNAPVDELNLQNIRQQILFPSYSLLSNKELMLIFQMGGDSRTDRRRKLVGDLYEIMHSAVAIEERADLKQVTFIYELDADNEGVGKRVEQVNEEIRQIVTGFSGLTDSASYVVMENIRWGAYIFSNESGLGKLEDIILPMMEKDNEDVAECAKEFVDKRDTFVLFKGKKPMKYPQKARVGVMGQLEKEGCPNSAIIEQSSYLTTEKILASPVCEKLFDFLSK